MQGHMNKSIVNTTEPDSMKTKKTCSHKGCTSYARKGGVCVTNGAKVKRCSFRDVPIKYVVALRDAPALHKREEFVGGMAQSS